LVYLPVHQARVFSRFPKFSLTHLPVSVYSANGT
jgi:hypothetical protein